METITGVVQEVKNFGVGKGSGIVLSDGQKYGCYDPNAHGLHSVMAGNTVSFTMTEKGAYKNIKGPITVTGTGTPPPAAKAAPAKSGGYGGKSWAFPIPALDGQRAIVRQNSVTNATNLYVGIIAGSGLAVEVADMDTCADQIIQIAKKFEAYSTGDLDSMEADEALKKMDTVGGE